MRQVAGERHGVGRVSTKAGCRWEARSLTIAADVMEPVRTLGATRAGGRAGIAQRAEAKGAYPCRK